MYMEIIEIILRHWAWPIFLFVIIMIFRKQISEFLQRLKTFKISSMGVEAVIPTEQKVEEIKKPLPPEKEIIKDVGEEYGKTITDKYIEILEKYIFERTLNVIYGTQMDLLESLLKKGTLGEKYNDLKRFYYYFHIRSKFMTNTTETDYFGFLKELGYIEYIGEGEEQIVKITPLGVDFLSHVKKLYPTTYRNRPSMKF